MGAGHEGKSVGKLCDSVVSVDVGNGGCFDWGVAEDCKLGDVGHSLCLGTGAGILEHDALAVANDNVVILGHDISAVAGSNVSKLVDADHLDAESSFSIFARAPEAINQTGR